MKPLQIRCIPFGALALMAWLTALGAPKLGDPPEAKDLTLVGYHDLQARSAYQPLVREQNGRWILYVGHHGGKEGARRAARKFKRAAMGGLPTRIFRGPVSAKKTRGTKSAKGKKTRARR